MTRRTVAATLLGCSVLTGCWVVIGESFDGYEAGDPPLGPYVSESRTLPGSSRSYLLARPNPTPAGLPLVFSLHGEGQTSAQMRAALPLETMATSGAVFVYPSTPAGAFNTAAGRSDESLFVAGVFAQLLVELRIDANRLFIAGFDDGAIMANAVACELGPSVVRGVGIAAGTIYPLSDQKFTIDPTTGAASCGLPAAILTWGVSDPVQPLSIEAGRDTRNTYLATNGCAPTPVPWSIAPCTTYQGCARPVVWCEIEGLGHAIWPGAAAAMWSFFDGLK